MERRTSLRLLRIWGAQGAVSCQIRISNIGKNERTEKKTVVEKESNRKELQ